MRIDIVSIFPQLVKTVGEFGVTRIALERSILELNFWDPRDYCEDNYRRIDDRPYGGGPGMVMQAPPHSAAIRQARSARPQGSPLDQATVERLAGEQALILLAGRYEGIDQRLLDTEVDEELSIGDYVVAGGELPAMVLIEALVRYLPGVLGNEESAQTYSFSTGLLDWPHYTRPENFEGKKVPSTLLGGNHNDIRRWRLRQALGQTWLRRPDLLAKRFLSEEECLLLDEFKEQLKGQESS